MYRTFDRKELLKRYFFLIREVEKYQILSGPDLKPWFLVFFFNKRCVCRGRPGDGGGQRDQPDQLQHGRRPGPTQQSGQQPARLRRQPRGHGLGGGA